MGSFSCCMCLVRCCVVHCLLLPLSWALLPSIRCQVPFFVGLLCNFPTCLLARTPSIHTCLSSLASRLKISSWVGSLPFLLRLTEIISVHFFGRAETGNREGHSKMAGNSKSSMGSKRSKKGKPENRKYGKPEFRVFHNFRSPISENPDFRESENPDFQISGLPSLRKSGFPENDMSYHASGMANTVLGS